MDKYLDLLLKFIVFNLLVIDRVGVAFLGHWVKSWVEIRIQRIVPNAGVVVRIQNIGIRIEVHGRHRVVDHTRIAWSVEGVVLTHPNCSIVGEIITGHGVSAAVRRLHEAQQRVLAGHVAGSVHWVRIRVVHLRVADRDQLSGWIHHRILNRVELLLWVHQRYVLSMCLRIGFENGVLVWDHHIWIYLHLFIIYHIYRIFVRIQSHTKILDCVQIQNISNIVYLKICQNHLILHDYIWTGKSSLLTVLNRLPLNF